MTFVSNYSNSNTKLDLYQIYGRNGERPLSAQKSSEIKEYLNKNQHSTSPENDTFTRSQATSESQKNNKDTYSRADLLKNLKNNLTSKSQTNNDKSSINSENTNSQELDNQVNDKQNSEYTKEQEDPTSFDSQELTEEERQKVQELKNREQEVRTHENQHKAVGGQYAQAPSYTYENGPDGKKYIVDGEVQISISEEKTPKQTIEKMKQVHKAALAPAQPSGADKSVASQAQQIMNKAQQELNRENQQTNKSENNEDSDKKDQKSTQNQENISRSIAHQNNVATEPTNTNSSSFKKLSAKTQEQIKQNIANTYHNSYKSSGINNSTFNYTF
ncbi:MAG: putative metalloprotease CJM1_0395 family protein [Succinivibrionaceae bacterium]